MCFRSMLKTFSPVCPLQSTIYAEELHSYRISKTGRQVFICYSLNMLLRGSFIQFVWESLDKLSSSVPRSHLWGWLNTQRLLKRQRRVFRHLGYCFWNLLIWNNPVLCLLLCHLITLLSAIAGQENCMIWWNDEGKWISGLLQPTDWMQILVMSFISFSVNMLLCTTMHKKVPKWCVFNCDHN